MGWKKCPNCELNYIDEKNLYCEYCIKSNSQIRSIVNKIRYEEELKRDREIIEKEKTEELQYRKELLELLNTFGFNGFLHTTSLNNFINIYKTKKILPRIKLENNSFEDCANPEIISKTSDFLKSCVRFYYRAKTPTNVSAYKDFKQLSQVILVLDKNEIYNDNAYFSNMNAKSIYARCSNRAKNALKYDWEKVFAEGPLKNEDDFIEKSERNAEFLIFGDVDLSKISKIVFRTTFDMDEAIKKLGLDERFVVNSLMFYRGK